MTFEFALFSCFSSPSPSPALLKDFVFYKSASLALESQISSLICARHFVPLKLHFYISSQWSYICRLLLTFTLIKLNPFIIPLSYKELWRWGAQKNGCKRLNCLGKGALLVANEDAFHSCIKMIIKNIDRCFFLKQLCINVPERTTVVSLFGIATSSQNEHKNACASFLRHSYVVVVVLRFKCCLMM